MITKAIILEVFCYTLDGEQQDIENTSESATTNKNKTVSSKKTSKEIDDNGVGSVFYRYRIRIPIIDGYGDNANVLSDEEITHTADVCVLPHMQSMKYSVGDVVYIAMEDLSSDYPLILGMVSTSQIEELKGSGQTESKISFEKFGDLVVDPENQVVLPYNLLIRASQNDYSKEDFTDSTYYPYVTGEQISYSRGVTAPIQDQFFETSRAITDSLRSIADIEVKVTTPKTGVKVDKDIWLFNSGYPEVNTSYAFKYDSINKVYIDALYSNKKYTRTELKKNFGIEILEGNSAPPTIIVTVTLKPIKITAGGTGADNAGDACVNLGITRGEIMDSATFATKQVGELQANTIYYIY